VGGEFPWTSNQELDSGLMFSKKFLRLSFDDEKHDSSPSLKKKNIDNYNKIEIVNERGNNMDRSKVRPRDLVTIRSNIKYYKTFIDKKISHVISL
jgi:hypothetical protein